MKIDYETSGVSFKRAQSLVSVFKQAFYSTRRYDLISSFGGFFSALEVPENLQKPLLISTMDGVGTKIKLAQQMKNYQTIGIDLVAMNVNDLLVSGCEPVAFLDTISTGKIDLEIIQEIVSGIINGCSQSSVMLVGGETAELPGMLKESEVDLSGVALGWVEKELFEQVSGSLVQPGQIVVGIESSGFHSNGYSLIRKLIGRRNLDRVVPGTEETLGELLLKPTYIYTKVLREILNCVPVFSLAHITGGGLLENIPRTLPPFVKAVLFWDSWERPPIFDFLLSSNRVSLKDQWQTFNCGIGFTLVIEDHWFETVKTICKTNSFRVWKIGEIQEKKSELESSLVIRR